MVIEEILIIIIIYLKGVPFSCYISIFHKVILRNQKVKL